MVKLKRRFPWAQAALAALVIAQLALMPECNRKPISGGQPLPVAERLFLPYRGMQFTLNSSEYEKATNGLLRRHDHESNAPHRASKIMRAAWQLFVS